MCRGWLHENQDRPDFVGICRRGGKGGGVVDPSIERGRAVQDSDFLGADLRFSSEEHDLLHNKMVLRRLEFISSVVPRIATHRKHVTLHRWKGLEHPADDTAVSGTKHFE